MTRPTGEDAMSSEHVEVLERLRGVLEHGKMGDKCLIAPDLVTAAIAALSAPQSGDWVLVPREPTPEMLSAAGRLQACECGFVGDMSPMDGEEYAAMLAAAPQPPAEAQERPAKPAECADGCPDQQVCDHCQWPPGPDAEAQPDARGVVDEGSRAAQQQGGGDLDEVVCLACGDPIMPMGQVCHACSHPVSEPPSAPDVAMEAWHSAVDNAAELRANAPDERYAKRAARVESWIKANRPSPPSAPVGVEGLIEEWESNLAEDRRDGVAEVAIRAQEIQLDQLRALAQQGGAE